MDESTRHALIKGGVRTICELVPGVGGAIANAWSEYDAHRQNQRIEEFFRQFAERLKTIEDSQGDLRERIAQLPDAAELMDKVAELVKRESVDGKRHQYVSALGSFVAAPSSTSHDDRVSIIDSIESLTEQDMRYLLMFEQAEKLRGDMISGTTNAGWSKIGDDQSLSRRYEAQLGPAIHSLAKLEGRGLLTQDEMSAWFSSTGDSSAWYNQFRQKTWRITPMGKKLLAAVKP